MSNEIQWTYFDKKRLLPSLRRRQQIGRAEIPPLEWQGCIGQRLPSAWMDTFISDVVSAFVWICPTEAIPEIWTLWLLSNGALYMAPVENSKFRTWRDDRHFDELVSADTAGLIATLLAANWRASRTQDGTAMRSVVKFEKLVKSFVDMHPDVLAILNVID